MTAVAKSKLVFVRQRAAATRSAPARHIERHETADGRFRVERRKSCYGVILPAHWFAMEWIDTAQLGAMHTYWRILSVHKTRLAAERACQREARRG